MDENRWIEGLPSYPYGKQSLWWQQLWRVQQLPELSWIFSDLFAEKQERRTEKYINGLNEATGFPRRKTPRKQAHNDRDDRVRRWELRAEWKDEDESLFMKGKNVCVDDICVKIDNPKTLEGNRDQFPPPPSPGEGRRCRDKIKDDVTDRIYLNEEEVCDFFSAEWNCMRDDGRCRKQESLMSGNSQSVSIFQQIFIHIQSKCLN